VKYKKKEEKKKRAPCILKDISNFEDDEVSIYGKYFVKGWATKELKGPMGPSFARKTIYVSLIKDFYQFGVDYTSGVIQSKLELNPEVKDRDLIDLLTTREIHNSISDLTRMKNKKEKQR